LGNRGVGDSLGGQEGVAWQLLKTGQRGAQAGSGGAVGLGWGKAPLQTTIEPSFRKGFGCFSNPRCTRPSTGEGTHLAEDDARQRLHLRDTGESGRSSKENDGRGDHSAKQQNPHCASAMGMGQKQPMLAGDGHRRQGQGGQQALPEGQEQAPGSDRADRAVHQDKEQGEVHRRGADPATAHRVETGPRAGVTQSLPGINPKQSEKTFQPVPASAFSKQPRGIPRIPPNFSIHLTCMTFPARWYHRISGRVHLSGLSQKG